MGKTLSLTVPAGIFKQKRKKANDIEDPEGWACEARRYYFGIVGKFGKFVQTVLKKAADLDIQIICPLHGHRKCSGKLH